MGTAAVLFGRRVLYRKKTGEKEFVIVDTLTLNDLIRPALYSAHHADPTVASV